MHITDKNAEFSSISVQNGFNHKIQQSTGIIIGHKIAFTTVEPEVMAVKIFDKFLLVRSCLKVGRFKFIQSCIYQ